MAAQKETNEYSKELKLDIIRETGDYSKENIWLNRFCRVADTDVHPSSTIVLPVGNPLLLRNSDRS